MLTYIIKKERLNPKSIYRVKQAISKINLLKLFDEKFYLERYPDVKNSKIDPLCHYIYHGYKEKRIPSEAFNGNYYLEKYSDVKKSRQNPLIHYVLHGKNEGRFPNKKSGDNSLEGAFKLIKKQSKEFKKQSKEFKKQSKEFKKQSKEFKKQIKSQQKKIKDLIKYSKIYSMKSINKEKIGSEIENFKGYGITKEKRSQKLIVSLTSCPDRMYDIHYTIYSLLKQTCLPDEVILWLAVEKFPNLEEDVPKKILELKKHGLTIKWCENLKSYKKLIFALQEYPNDIIITADDDIYYPEMWLEKLYNTYQENPENIICHRAHLVKFDGGKFQPYTTWPHLIQNSKASFLNFFTGCGGILYPPKSLYKDVLNKKLFMNLAPNGDDIWFWSMSLLNNKKIKIVEDGYKNVTYINPKRELNIGTEKTLYAENKEGKNDNQLKKIVNYYYPEIIDKIKNEEIYPKVSVIMPVYNAEKYLEKSVESVLKQTLKDIELICINDGSIDNSLEILEKYAENDGRIKLINQKNQGAPTAINNGFKEAKGEYIGFVDADDWVDLDFFETLYYEAKSQNADIARTFYKYSYPNKEVPHSLNKLIGEKYWVKEPLGINDHSIVNWNAIYRKKYLIDNDIYYYDNTIVYDVPFTARATFYSKKTVPVIRTYYHYRQEVENQMSVMSLKRVKSVLEANKICLDFFNSVEYYEKDDYLTSFKRCMWRYDHVFGEGLKIEEFDEKKQKKFFEEFVCEFNKCNFPKRLKAYYYESYFDYMDENLFEEYLKYKKSKISLIK